MEKGSDRAIALWSILGFACNQGFVYSLFYLTYDGGLPLGSFVLPRGGLLCALAFMVVSFIVMARASAKVRNALLARPLLWGYAALLLLAAFIPVLPGSDAFGALVLKGALMGLPSGFLLVSWGRALGCQPIDRAVPEVVLGSALAGALCLVCAVCDPYLLLLPKALPLAGVFLLRKLVDGTDAQRAEAEASAGGSDSREASRLSGKILLGAALYGLVVGFTESFLVSDGPSSAVGVAVTMFFFVMFCLAVYQMVGEDGVSGKASLKRDAAKRDGAKREGPLDGAYRLAIMLIVGGILFAPVLADLSVSGESVLVAGYLGLTTVLVALFLVMGKIAGGTPVVSFSLGFAALFGGEVVGILLRAVPVMPAGVSFGLATAGVAALIAYLFVFTERDFRDVSVAVADTDTFAKACELMGAAYGLSPREAEILPLALRGRTGERMAQELFVSKSTVDTHLRRIYAKCGVHSRQELIDLGECVQREGRAPGKPSKGSDESESPKAAAVFDRGKDAAHG